MFVAASLAMVGAPRASAELIDGFTEPFLTTNVATAETGVIISLSVREGEVVKKGQALALLDNDLHLALVEIASEQMRAVGKLQSATAELTLQERKFEKLQELRERGHARPEELERTRTDVLIARAQLLAIKEDLAVRKLEHERTRLQLERRTIRAPHDGVIAKTHKQEGEFVAPNEPIMFTLVQLDPLVASFSVPSHLVGAFRLRQKVFVGVEGHSASSAGAIELISPVTEAESGTVRIKVRLENPKGLLRSGERCTLQLPAPAQAAR
jgi:RND family efflux transporter MFP subunit